MLRIRGYRIVAVLSFGVASLVAAQGTPEGAQDHVAALRANLQKSIAELHTYQWVQTTVVSIKGDEKSRTADTCFYGPDGTIQKTPLGGEPESAGKKPRGIRGRIAERKKEDISDSMKSAIALVKEYVPPDPAKIQAAKDAGKLSVAPAGTSGVLNIVIKDYLKQGDSMTLVVDSSKDLLTEVKVASYTDKASDTVNMAIQFGVFTNMTVYPEKITLDVAKESVGVVITNSNYAIKGA